MKTPYISINLAKIEHNSRTIVNQCKKHGISVAGITKVTLGNHEVAEAMIRGGVEWIGESRLDNIDRLRNSNIKVPFLLMRTPHISEIDRVVQIADVSLNSEYEVIRKLSESSIKVGKRHKIIIMVDTGDLREGVWPNELNHLINNVKLMKGIEIIGLGTNLIDLNGVVPTNENNQYFVELAEKAEKDCNVKFNILSAGNSSSLKLMQSGEIPKRINHFRIGEGIVLGRETINREKWEDTYQDAFVLHAEVIEKKLKPSVPIGEIGQNAFGDIPKFVDRGNMMRAILNIGRQDTNVEGLIPYDKNIEILGSSSDHLVIDITNCKNINVGDLIPFNVNYAALLASMTSPFVDKTFI